MEEASSIAKAIETAWNRAGQPTEFTVKVLELPQTSFFGLKTSKSAKVAFFFNEATVTAKSKDSSRPEASSSRQGQRPVTLRQPGSKPESDKHDQRRPYQGQRPERSETREQRESREPRERENRSFEQRSDQRNRPHNQRRSDFGKPSSDRPDYAKSLDSRSGVNVPSAHAEEHRADTLRRASDRQDDRPRRHDDRRPRHEGSEQGYSQERETWTPEMVQIAQEWIKETLVLMGKPDISVNTHVSHNYLKISLSAPVLEDARQEETQLKSWGMLAMEAVREKASKPLRSLRIILESNK